MDIVCLDFCKAFDIREVIVPLYLVLVSCTSNPVLSFESLTTRKAF